MQTVRYSHLQRWRPCVHCHYLLRQTHVVQTDYCNILADMLAHWDPSQYCYKRAMKTFFYKPSFSITLKVGELLPSVSPIKELLPSYQQLRALVFTLHLTASSDMNTKSRPNRSKEAAPARAMCIARSKERQLAPVKIYELIRSLSLFNVSMIETENLICLESMQTCCLVICFNSQTQRPVT